MYDSLKDCPWRNVLETRVNSKGETVPFLEESVLPSAYEGGEPMVLGVIVLIVGILQIPAALVTLPAIAYLWFGGDASTASNIAFTVYLFVAGLADNVLKPMLLGRGVDAPTLVGAWGAWWST